LFAAIADRIDFLPTFLEVDVNEALFVSNDAFGTGEVLAVEFIGMSIETAILGCAMLFGLFPQTVITFVIPAMLTVGFVGTATGSLQALL
jgi:hypothetical protein